MSNFRKVREEVQEKLGAQAKVRTNYRCAAYGCPNAGAIDDHGEAHRGRCFWHWRAPVQDWDKITTQIRHDDSMRNHGIVPLGQSKGAQETASKVRAEMPRGIRTDNGPAL